MCELLAGNVELWAQESKLTLPSPFRVVSVTARNGASDSCSMKVTLATFFFVFCFGSKSKGPRLSICTVEGYFSHYTGVQLSYAGKSGQSRRQLHSAKCLLQDPDQRCFRCGRHRPTGANSILFYSVCAVRDRWRQSGHNQFSRDRSPEPRF